MNNIFSFIFIIFLFSKIKLKKNKNFCEKKLFLSNEICLKESKKIIISLTSWPKRIVNVGNVINSLLNQEIPPDLIELNLCELEFPNKKNNLPNDLKILLKKYKNIEINWVPKNTGVFKKIIPTIEKFYGTNYYLLSVDDDWIYNKKYIKTMIYYIERFNSDSFCLSKKSKIIGNRMIYKSESFDFDFKDKLTDEIINAKISDAYIYHYLKQKKKKMAHQLPKKYKKFCFSNIKLNFFY
jgi:hypothetical protein